MGQTTSILENLEQGSVDQRQGAAERLREKLEQISNALESTNSSISQSLNQQKVLFHCETELCKSKRVLQENNVNNEKLIKQFDLQIEQTLEKISKYKQEQDRIELEIGQFEKYIEVDQDQKQVKLSEKKDVIEENKVDLKECVNEYKRL